ncbi:MAG TPA: hemolysin family protein [Gemmatimonadaceae bacterium]|nr:hemolysin family protein [Gemmatimonadaceae bacterium]
MITLALVILVALAVSFLCSILEAVLLSVSHAYVAMLRDSGHRAGRLLAAMRKRIDEPIAAILTLNTIAHTVGAALSGAIALRVFGDRWLALFSAVLTLLILIFSEIVPKTIGATYWKRLAPFAAYVLRALIVILKPVLVPLAAFNRLITPRGKPPITVSRAELEILAEIGRREGTIDEHEWRVVSNIINLDQVHVSEVMTPRTDIVAVPVGATVENVEEVMLEEGHLRLPVYRETLDDIVGIVLARDLWRAAREGVSEVNAVMREPNFVPSTKPVDELITEMRRQRLRMVIVLDEYGGTAGLATLEDLIEEIVGEIQDEHEQEPLPFEELAEGEVRISGGASLNELSERYELPLPVDRYDTVGGFVFGKLGRIPRLGDEITLPGGRFRVLAMDGRRIRRVAWIPKAAPAGENAAEARARSGPEPKAG